MSEHELDEAVEKLSGAIKMLTARIDDRVMLMSLFKVFAETSAKVKDPELLIALSDDFLEISVHLKQRATGTLPTNLN